MFSFLSNLDGNILLWIQACIRQPFLSPVMILITHLGDNGYIWIAITAVCLIGKKTRKTGVLMACALLGALLVDNVILKPLVARVRPNEIVEGLKLLIPKQWDYSFPSGHAGSSFAAAVVMFKLMPKRSGIPALILAFLISFSRLYVGIHYPSDVLAGMIIGTVIALLVCKYMPDVILKTAAKRNNKQNHISQ